MFVLLLHFTPVPSRLSPAHLRDYSRDMPALNGHPLQQCPLRPRHLRGISCAAAVIYIGEVEPHQWHLTVKKMSPKDALHYSLQPARLNLITEVGCLHVKHNR